MRKKLAALLLIFILLFSFTGCTPTGFDALVPGDLQGSGGGSGGQTPGGDTPGGNPGGDVSDEERNAYELSLSEWSESGHLYFHYKRYVDTKAEYDQFDIWLWQNKPRNLEGRIFDYVKQDVSGAVFDIDLTVEYKDGGKTGDITVDYIGATRLGFLVVEKASRDSGGHWKSDGGEIYIDNFDTLARDDGSIHVFISEGVVSDYKLNFGDVVEREDPYKNIPAGSAVSKINVDSSKTEYGVTATAPDFYKTAGVGYQIQVSSFADSDGDGFGDIRGITENLDYLKDTVHANVLWLTPVQKSGAYHGYDISDLYAIDPKFGTEADYRELLYEAHKRGIKVLMDLVINHTSKSNIWFEKSVNLVKEKVVVGGVEQEIDYRNFYNWRSKKPTDASANGWYSYGSNEKQYYYFSSFNDSMPELNYDYQGTRDAMVDVALYWLGYGLDGLRLDAVKHVYIEGEYTSAKTNNDVICYDSVGSRSLYDRNVTKNTAFFQEFNARIKSVYPDAFLVGENFDGNAQNLAPYYAGMDSQFDFNLYYNMGRDAIANSNYSQAFDQYVAGRNSAKTYRSDYIGGAFTSNHDVSRAINLMCGGATTANVDRQTAETKLRAWSSVVLTLPGLSWIYYGDELGMEGDKGSADVPHADRWLRQPFKWTTADKDAGGSKYITGFSFDKYTIEWNDYNKLTPGVAEQKLDENSMLRHFSSLTALKSSDPVLICGDFNLITGVPTGVFAFTRSYGGKTYRIYHNLTGSSINLSAGGTLIWASQGATQNSLPAYRSVIVKV